MDALDTKAAEAFEGFLVRKDLAHQFRGQYPVPTYVGEFLLGRYCATTDPDEITEGLALVQKALANRTVRAGEDQLFKARARDAGRMKIIDLLKARLNTGEDRFEAELPSLQETDIHIDDELVNRHERMLTGGFYAEVTLQYLPQLGRQPFRIDDIRPIQMSTPNALDQLVEGRALFTIDEWRRLLLRSVGFEPAMLSQRQQDVLIARMVPFVVSNYNAIELGPRGTGKSHLFQQVSPYAYLVSGGKATVATMFVNNATRRRGLVAQYDVVCFDEVAGISFDSKDGVNILKGYMASGEFGRGRESIRAEGGIVLVGNFEVDVWEQLRRGHLLAPLPKEMRDDTAFMDRIHAFWPGWDVPKLDPNYFTSHFGFVSDFLAECWSQLRRTSHMDAIAGRVEWGPALSGRDRKASENTLNGLLKLLYPDPEMSVPDDELAKMATLAVELRRRVKEQQAHIGKDEFGDTDLAFSLGGGPMETVFCEETVKFARDMTTAAEKGLPEPDPGELSSPGPPPQEYQVGGVIDDRFEVLGVLGAGGYSRVYKVNDRLEGEIWALKVFNSADSYEAVRREVGALRKVKHPSVVDVHWAGKSDRGEWFLVTEFVDGSPLAEVAYGQRRLLEDESFAIAEQLLEALEAIHPDAVRITEIQEKQRDGVISMEELHELQQLQDEGLVHRDVKPENIILTESGLKLLDFNITSRVGDPVVTVAATKMYAAPDPIQEWDVSTDLFAVGVILYMLLTYGKHPYPNEAPNVALDVIDPRTFRQELSEEVAALLMRACAPWAADRFQSASEMRRALLELGG